MKKLTIDDCIIELICEPEIMEICEDFDERTKNFIIHQLNDGHVWPWCQVEVKVWFDDFCGHDCLGGCSYESEEQFKQDGYYQDMVDNAFDELKDKIKRKKEILERITL